MLLILGELWLTPCLFVATSNPQALCIQEAQQARSEAFVRRVLLWDGLSSNSTQPWPRHYSFPS